MIYIILFIIAAGVAIYTGCKSDSLMLTIAGIIIGISGVFLFLQAVSDMIFFGWIAFIFFCLFLVIMVASISGDESLKHFEWS
jgi:CRISPR/Cas system-associated protein Csm6